MTEQRGSAVVALVFCDLVGSTALLSRLGDEANDAVRRRSFAELRAAVVDHGGVEVKSLGDGLMASYRSAVDALASAVAMQQGMARLAADDRSLDLALRVGVAIGEATFENDDWFGTPVVEAARLCGAAAAGQVLATDVVRAMVGTRGGHEFVPVGALELKGLGEPVQAVSVAWQPPELVAPLPAGLESRSPVSFIGRPAELKSLEGSWTASADRVRLALIAGEPGIGKSRLAAELAGTLHDDGAVVLFGRCDPELGVPYQPFAEALRGFAHTAPTDQLAAAVLAAGPLAGELVRLAPDLAARVAGLPEPLAAEPEAERHRLFEATTEFLAALCRTSRVLFVVDDLHWAGKPTLLLLRHVLRSAELPGLLVLGTYRDTDLDRTHPLSAALADLRRETDVDRVSITGLTPDEVGDFVTAAAGGELGFDVGGLAKALHDETEGNPFFVGQVLLHLRDNGAVVQEGGRWQVTSRLNAMGIPEGVREVVGSRLSKLGEEANRLLQVASVIGRQFDLAVLAQVAEMDQDVALDRLDESVAARLLSEVPEAVGRFSFSHALVRDTLYAELTTTRRVRLHDRIATCLARLDTDAWLPQLAYHAAEASAGGDRTRAVEYGLRAGERAMEQLAYEEATEHFLRALGCLDDIAADTQRLDLLLGLGAARWRAGETALSREAYHEAVDLARELGDAERFGRAAIGVVGMWYEGGAVDPVLVALLDEAIDMVPVQPSALRVRLMTAYGRVLVWADDPGEIAEVARIAVADARALGEPGPLAYALVTSTVAAGLGDDVLAYLASAEEAIGLAEEAADATLLMEARILATYASLRVGDLPRALEHLAQVRHLAETYRQPIFEWYARSWDASIAVMQGDIDEGLELAAAAAEIGQRARGPEALAAYSIQVYGAIWVRGELAQWLDALEAYVDLYPGIEAWRGGRAWFRAVAGDLAGARADIASFTRHGTVELKKDVNYEVGLYCLAQAIVLLDDREAARLVYDALAPYAGTQVAALAWLAGGGIWGDANQMLGCLALTLGETDTAVGHLEAAIENNGSIGARLLTALGHLQLSVALRRRGGTDDAARAVIAEDAAAELAPGELANLRRACAETTSAGQQDG